MAWYSIYGNDAAFEKRYQENPHLYHIHQKDFEELKDEYLQLANSYHPIDYDDWKKGVGKLFKYEKKLYAKVDRWYNCIIVSYYDFNHRYVYWDYDKNGYCEKEKDYLFQRFIYNTSTSKMYHYRMKNFKNIAYVLNPCDGQYKMGGWTDFDRFYTQEQRKLDKKSIEILKSINLFEYLPIEKFKKISVYKLFQISDEMIYQYEILLKNGLEQLATDLLLARDFISKENFKKYKQQIMSGIRLKNLKKLIYQDEQRELKRKRKIEEKKKSEIYSRLPKEVYDLGDYILMHPKTSYDLKHEGNILQHCVGGYINRIIQGETDVMLLRKKEEPDKPFFTVEIRDGMVTQVRTLRNQTDPDISSLVKNWFEQKAVGNWN